MHEAIALTQPVVEPPIPIDAERTERQEEGSEEDERDSRHDRALPRRVRSSARFAFPSWVSEILPSLTTAYLRTISMLNMLCFMGYASPWWHGSRSPDRNCEPCRSLLSWESQSAPLANPNEPVGLVVEIKVGGNSASA